MKKPKTVLFLLSLSAFLLAGCLPKKTTEPAGTTPQTEQNQTQEEGKTIFDSIKDAMSKSLSLECKYAEKETEVVAYIKGKSVRSDSEYQGTKTSVIIKDNQMWLWTNKDNQGMVLDVGESSQDQAGQTGTTNPDDVIEAIEKYKQNCRQTIVADSLFNPPGNIDFQDLSQMLKNFGVTTKP